MQRIAIILLGLASLVASGVIMDRGGRVGLNANFGLGLQTEQGIRGGVGGSGVVNTLSRDELLRQKFILDVLHQVYKPLQQQDLLVLDDRSQVTNENLYQRPLTQEMQLVLDLIRSQQVLGKQTICRINNELHLQQMLGLYRLLVTARDFDSFKRLVVHARQNINTEMFVNALVLALGERSDTQNLIVPALYEILAQIYQKDQVIDEIAQLDTGVSSVRPQLIDVIGMRRQQGLWNSRLQQQQGGLFDVLNRSQLWMPWRELHKQMALRKIMGGNVVQQGANQNDKLVIPLPGNGLLSEDVGLKAYVNILVDELIVNQDVIRNSNRNQRNGQGGLGRDANEHGIWGNRGQINKADNLGGLGRNRGANEEDYLNNQQRNSLGGRRDDSVGQGINSDRLLFVGRRQRVQDDQLNRDSIGGHRLGSDIDELNRNRDINAGRRLGLDAEDDLIGNHDINRQGINKYESDIHNSYGNARGGYNNDQLLSGRGLRNRLDLDNEQDLERNVQLGGRNQQEGQNGINTVSVNDARLLFVGRRRKNPNHVVDTSGRNNYNDNDEISGGRRVAKEGKDNKEERQWNKQQQQQQQYDDEDNLYDIRRLNNERSTNSERYINVNRRGMLWDQNNDNEDHLYSNLNLGSRYQQQNSDVYGNQHQGQGQGQGSGRGLDQGQGRDDFLNIVTRGGLGQRQYYDQGQDLMFNHGNIGQYNRESLDQHLPTTSIYDERLLHINRHKLSNVEEGRRVNNILGDFDDDEDHSHAGQQRGNNNQAGSRFEGRRVNNRQGDFDDDEDHSQAGQQRGNNNQAGSRFEGRRESLDQHLPTTSINDERLLHINRHKLSNVEEGRRVNNIQGDFDDDEDHSQAGQQRGKNNQAGSRFEGRRVNNRQGDFDDDEDHSQAGQQRGNNNQAGSRFEGRRESLDQHLPTTSINDERLLHINRHKLSNVEEGRRVNNIQGDFDDDEDHSQAGQQRGNNNQAGSRFEGRRVNNRQGDFDDDEDHSQAGQQRGNNNQAGSRFDEQSNRQRNAWAINRQGYQNNRDNDNDNDSKRGQNRGQENNSGYRYRRSLLNQNQQLDQDNDNSISGKLLLHTLQQLVARLNVERIALGQPQLIANNQNNQGRGQGGQISLNRNDIRGVDVQTANKIEEIIQRIDNVLQQRIGDISVLSYNQKVNEIGLLLAGQIQDIGLIQILAEIQQQGSLQQQQRKGQVANILDNQAAQILFAGIVQVIDNRVQQVYKQREEFISTVRGVTINHVDVDKLQTYLEHAEIDLSNLLNNNLDQSKEVVGRVPRLNHKNFNIEVDVNSDRQQQVVVRNLLVPKVDGLGNIIPLQQRRQNVIVLDITTVQLQPGHNLLTLRSNDITLTARDTTPLTQIYQHVMLALNGNNVLQQDLLVGQTNKLPHRLLLPRGRINGLPMQLITVITPVQRSAGLQRGNGLDNLLLDRLPLNYPLHCDITDLDRVVSMPNLIVKDVKIYHDDNIKIPLSHLY